MAINTILFDFHKSLCFLLTFFLLLQLSYSLYEIEVYRMFGYEDDGVSHGCKVASLNLIASHFNKNIARKLALIKLSEITDEVLVNIMNRKPGGILIIMPTHNQLPNEAEIWKTVSRYMNLQTIHFPIYYCYDNYEILKIYQSLQEGGDEKKQDELMFIVRAEEPKIIPALVMEDFYGVLEDMTHFRAHLPTLMLVANYDAFAPSADFKVGFDVYGSGVVVLLNIMKEFSKLSRQNLKLNYNLLFYLTSSRFMGFESMKNWLNKPENSKLTSNIESIFFLDSFASKPELYLQVFHSEIESVEKPVNSFLELINQTATLYRKPFNILTISEDILSLGNKKVKFFSFSDEITPVSSKLETQLREVNYSNETFNNNMLFMTELVVKLSLNISKDFKLLERQHNIDFSFVEEMKKILEDGSRFPIYIQKDAKLNREFHKIFNYFLKQSKSFVYTYQKPKFFTSKVSKLIITQMVSPFIDLYLFFGTLVWFLALYLLFSKEILKSHRD